MTNNDDVETGNTNSQITRTLAAGTYTVEATTYSEGGDWRLHPEHRPGRDNRTGTASRRRLRVHPDRRRHRFSPRRVHQWSVDR